MSCVATLLRLSLYFQLLELLLEIKKLRHLAELLVLWEVKLYVLIVFYCCDFIFLNIEFVIKKIMDNLAVWR